MKIGENQTLTNKTEYLSDVSVDAIKTNSTISILIYKCINVHKCCSYHTYGIDSRKLTSKEYYSFISENSIYKLYEKFWQIRGAILPRMYICDSATSCHTEFLKFRSYDNDLEYPNDLHLHTTFTSLFPYIIPHAFPYMMHYSEISGLICTTPFFSIICANVKRVPDELFMLSNLNLNSVITNPIFRHELVFNPELYIEEPASTCESLQLEILWTQLISETEDIQKYPLTHAPLVFLPQVIEGLRALVLSLLPESLSSEVDYYVDANRLLCGDEAVKLEFLRELTRFICRAVETCAISLRKRHVDHIKSYLLEDTQQPHRLIKGIKIAIDLLNITKVDQINAKIKERASSLYLSSTNIEKINFMKHIEKGMVDISQACKWLNSQPLMGSVSDIEEMNIERADSLVNKSGSLSTSAEAAVLSKLVYGFINDYLAPDESPCHLNLFPLDGSRIATLMLHVKRHILKRLTFEAKKAYYHQNGEDKIAFKQLLRVPNVYDTKFYQLLKQRVKLELMEEVFSNLSMLLGYRDSGDSITTSPHSHTNTQFKPDKLVVKETVTILFLHWTSAHNFYCG